MKELITILEKVIGKKGFPLYLPGFLFKLIGLISGTLFMIVNATPMLTKEKANELLASWEVSVKKAKKDFDFESQISFDDGASQTMRWYKDKGWLK